MSLNDVNQTLDIYLGSLYVNSFNDFGRHWQVTVQAEGQYRNQIKDINLFQVRNSQGHMVPLGTLVSVREIGGPLSIPRYNLYTIRRHHRQHPERSAPATPSRISTASPPRRCRCR